MYNEKRKNRFISSLSKNKDINDARMVFNKISVAEELLDTDVADCNYEQTIKICSAIGYTTYYRRNRWLSVLSMYVDFEIQHQYTKNSTNYVYYYKQNSQDNYNTDDDIIKNYLRDPSDAYNAFCTLFDEPKCNGRYIFYFAFLCLIYCGFSDEEIFKLTRADVDLRTQTIKNKKIYPEFWQAIIASLETTYKVGSGDAEYQLPSYLEEYIIKNDVKDFKLYLAQFISRARKANPQMLNSITIKRVEQSGYWYRLYLQEKLHPDEFVLPVVDKRDFLNYKKAFWE